MLDAWVALIAGAEPLDLADLIARPAWHGDALCREYPAELWFPRRGPGIDTAAIAAAAKNVCHSCLVQEECRAWATEQGPDLQGIFGGLSERERRQLRRQTAHDRSGAPAAA